LNVDNLAVTFDEIFFRMKFFFVIGTVFFCFPLFGQYYYNDLLANNQSNRQYQLLRSNKIRYVKVTSFDADNKQSTGFSLSQKFSPDYKKLITTSALDSNEASILTTSYENNKVTATSTIIKGIETKTEYLYDEKGLLQKIISSSIDTALNSNAAEQHIWFYTAKNQPDYMLKIKNGNDTTRVEFINDEHGNVVEEHWKKRNLSLETYYYYYNENNLLTDIVRFNKRAQRLLPDFLFEYDDQGRVVQMKQVPAGSSNYLIWKYVYNAAGLKQEEICQDKQKLLVGRIEYSYQ